MKTSFPKTWAAVESTRLTCVPTKDRERFDFFEFRLPV